MSIDANTVHLPGSSLPAALSNALVKVLREFTGRGPTKARTTIRDNVVVVMLEDTLTKGERVLVQKGRGENVLALRREYQEAMREESSAQVSLLTGRVVVAMMSANHINPDLAVEIYVLDGSPGPRATVDGATGDGAMADGAMADGTAHVPVDGVRPGPAAT